MVVILAVIALIVLEATGTTHVFTTIYSSIKSSIDAAVGAIAGLLAAVAAIVPSFKLAFASNKESNVSRGDVIFKSRHRRSGISSAFLRWSNGRPLPA